MKKDYIELKGDVLVAPANAYFSLKLIGAGWIRTGATIRTKDFDLALNHVQYFHPDLKMLLADVLTEDQKDKSYVPSTPEGLTLYPPQAQAVAYCLRRKHTLLALEAGHGKTPVSICVMNADKPKKVLIICPATLKYNWLTELRKWVTYDIGTIHIVNSDDYNADADVVIINYDILARHVDAISKTKFDFLICDEAHKLKSFMSRRTNIVFGGAVGVGKEQIIYPGIEASTRELYLSATPLDKHEHLWPLLTRVDSGGLGKDYNQYISKYCGAYSNGFGLQLGKSTNSEMLGTNLRMRFMYRFRPEDSIDLPPVSEQTILFPASSIIMEEQDTIIRDNIDILRQLSEEQDTFLPDEPTTQDYMQLVGDTFLEHGELMKRPEFAPLFNQMATIRKELGIAKVPLVIEHIKARAEEFDSMVIFAYHKEVIKQLCASVPAGSYVKVVGGMSAKKKDEAVKKFQNGEVKYFFGNITAAGEGLTLTRSHYQLFCEIDWNYTSMLQAKKRLDRISQEHPVTIDYLLIDASMDSIMGKKVVEKGLTVKGVFAE